MRSGAVALGVGLALLSCSRTAFVHTEPPAPVAIIAPTEVTTTLNQLVVLDGASSHDPWGEPLTWAWRISSKPALGHGQLDAPPGAHANLRLDRIGVWQVALIVSAGARQSSETTATITVVSLVGSPIANAGPDQAGTPQDTFFLDGSLSSDPGGQPLSFNWSVAGPPGSTPVLTAASSPARPSLTVDRVGRYEVTLTVTAGTRSGSDVALITVTSTNRPPIANAGVLRSYTVGSTAVLDGRGSGDPDGDPITLAWRLLAGPAPVVLSDATSVIPSFAATVVGDYRFELKVTDREGASALDDTTVRVLPRPDAGAGFDGGCDVFATGEVYLAGTLEEGACYRDALAHWSTPNSPSVGFECSFTSVLATIRPTDGRLLYRSTSSDVVREFHCDAVTDGGAYPSQVTANDPVVPTPCPAGEGLLGFFVSQEGTVLHMCEPGTLALRDSTGSIVVDLSPAGPLAVGAAGWVLTQTAVHRIQPATMHPITGLPQGNWLTTRWKEPDGFWVVLQGGTPRPLDPQLWLVETTGAAHLIGTYPPVPVSVRGTMGGRLDAAGRLFEMGDDLTSFDLIVRRELGGPADVVYTEATHPLVKMHLSSLLTGP